MTGNGSPVKPEPSIVDQLIATIPADVPEETRAMLESFARIYIRRIPSTDLPDIPVEQLYAEVSDLLVFIQSRGLDEMAIRVFSPSMDVCGYETTGTVVQVVVDDRPFLVDSMALAVSRSGVGIERHLHPLVGTTRDETGFLVGIDSARSSGRVVSVQHFELDRKLEPEAEAELVDDIRGTLRDLALIVRDFEPMQRMIPKMIEASKSGDSHFHYDEISESVEFLEWLLDDNFVFLGYRQYDIEGIDGDKTVKARTASGLGILHDNGVEPSAVLLSELPPYVRDRYVDGDLVVITKTNRKATVHRGARMDYVGVRRAGSDGKTITEHRLLGLFTSKAYMSAASEIPVLRRKLDQILKDQDLIEGSHDYKSVVQLFDSFPKDDLFSGSVESLGDTLSALTAAEDSERVRLFVRRDALRRSVSILVMVPRDRFNSRLRQELQQLFKEAYGGRTVDYRLSLGESGDARIHFSVWTEGGGPVEIDLSQLEAEVIALARTWEDKVVSELANTVGDSEANRLADRWAPGFPEYYKSSTAVSLVVGDILSLDRLHGGDADLVVGLQNESDEAKAPASSEWLTRITVYRNSGKLNLSAVVPLIEHLGLIVVEEVPTRLKGEDTTFIHDFGVLTSEGEQVDIEAVGDRMATAIEAVLAGEAESDTLHRLLVATDLAYGELAILRAYRNYWRLVAPAFSIGYVNDTLTAHPEIAEAFVRLFEARFDEDHSEERERAIAKDIRRGLDGVTSLDDDRILRGFFGLVLATERTNIRVEGRTSLSLKFASADVPEMPDPKPLHEIYVYAPGVEGVHLRGGAVARGGIRWSDRKEDYRTEVLGLMKAQMTKNAVIVPTGAKGGFVLRRSADAPRPSYEEVKEGYRLFIRGLLDVSDNRVGEEIVTPDSVVAHDSPDPYLVVAADKGTASFSDTANELAAEYGFWLDDAFASGGSAGYDHKELGITARGAWESVRRHFFDLGVNVDESEITVVGVGDMSGDVFGNGLLRSKKMRLIAAFDHRNIFFDPDPDPAASWDERMRVSLLARSSWLDYDADLISAGGGVFDRAAKSINLTDEMRSVLGSTAESARPNELIRMILKAPVDLLWNGGIGTYVKSKAETSELVQDRSNDAVRVNGREVGARVIGEGGNLGVTQRGRIEFDLAGGRVFADFIDNSGGVHASDREVNLKILLGMAELSGKIDRAERDGIIESVVDDVVAAILYDNFLQAQVLSQEAAQSKRTVELYADLMDRLEREGILDREIEFLPSAEEMNQRGKDGLGMTRPELSVLLAYAKRSLTDLLLQSDLPDDPHFEADLLGYFPEAVSDRFADEIKAHPLRRELISTIVANQALNSQGSTFYSRMRHLTGAPAARIMRAYRVAREITGADERWNAVEGLVGSIEPGVSHEMLRDIDRLVSTVARWYLNRPVTQTTIDEEIELSRRDFAALSEGMPNLDPPEWREPAEASATRMVDDGVPADIAKRHGYQHSLRRGPDIIELAHQHRRDVLEVAGIYTRVSYEFKVDWLERQIRNLPGITTFERLAAESLRDDLQQMRRRIVAMVMEETEGSLDAHYARFARLLPRRDRLFHWLERDGVEDISAGMVAVRRLNQIALGG
jgi:glutamate dehydrogenase